MSKQSHSAESYSGGCPRSCGERLALRPKDAARALGIGERLLWSLTNRGEVPHLRLGRAVVYPVDQLREWMAREAKKKEGRR